MHCMLGSNNKYYTNKQYAQRVCTLLRSEWAHKYLDGGDGDHHQPGPGHPVTTQCINERKERGCWQYATL